MDENNNRDLRDTDESIRIALVCVQNAGRSQMSTAFAKQELDRRGLDDRVELISGGTHPADSVHEIVIEAMREEGIDLVDRTPQKIESDQLESCEYVATMGCSTLQIDAPTVDVRDWALDDPHGAELEAVREIRAEIKRNVNELLDEVETRLGAEDDGPTGDDSVTTHSDE